MSLCSVSITFLDLGAVTLLGSYHISIGTGATPAI